MAFVVQFIRLRRGVPEVVHTLRVVAADGSAAMARAKRLISTRSWPIRTDGLRVVDEGGRTLIDWTAPTTAAQPTGPFPGGPSREQIGAPLQLCEEAREDEVRAVFSHHRFDVGQPVSYAEDGKPDIWNGGYEVIRLSNSGASEPQYAIRHADQSYDRVVWEHELCEDLGARVRGQ